MEVRRCIDCGASIEHRTLRAKRCEACANEKSKWDKKHPTYSEFIFPASAYPNDLKQCRKCYFWSSYSSCCDYAAKTGVTRLALHNGNTDDLYPCKEFKPKVGSRCGMDNRTGASCGTRKTDA